MISKIKFSALLLCIALIFSSCGIYSLSGANVEGKTIQIKFIENSASIVQPSLSPTLTEKIRSKILNQTSLSQSNGKTDYEISGEITGYDVQATAVTNDAASKNRLTITVAINFVNNINTKASFNRNYNKFADYTANQTLQAVEKNLIETISNDIADAIFNDAFVNW
jgi:hypothetical protein